MSDYAPENTDTEAADELEVVPAAGWVIDGFSDADPWESELVLYVDDDIAISVPLIDELMEAVLEVDRAQQHAAASSDQRPTRAEPTRGEGKDVGGWGRVTGWPQINGLRAQMSLPQQVLAIGGVVLFVLLMWSVANL